MATFVVVHGAGDRGSSWSLVAERLASAGHRTVAPDLPCEEEVGLGAYVDTVVDAIGDRDDDLVLVAHSLGGLIAPLVAAAVPTELLVLVTALTPAPGESGRDWWTAVGHAAALAAQDLPDDSEETMFLHDVPPDVLAAQEPSRDQTSTLFDEPWPLEAWPDVPTRFLLCRDDRFFPAAWMRDVVRDRLGIEPIEVPGGHCPYLSRPDELTAALLACWAEVVSSRPTTVR